MAELRATRKKIKRHNRFPHQLGIEGGRHLEIVDHDIVQSISQIEQAMKGMLAKLEIKFEKLELKVEKFEASVFIGSSSYHYRRGK